MLALEYEMTIELSALEVEQLYQQATENMLDGFSNDFAAICTAAEFDAVMYDMLSYPERISIRYLRVVPA